MVEDFFSLTKNFLQKLSHRYIWNTLNLFIYDGIQNQLSQLLEEEVLLLRDFQQANASNTPSIAKGSAISSGTCVNTKTPMSPLLEM